VRNSPAATFGNFGATRPRFAARLARWIATEAEDFVDPDNEKKRVHTRFYFGRAVGRDP